MVVLVVVEVEVLVEVLVELLGEVGFEMVLPFSAFVVIVVIKFEAVASTNKRQKLNNVMFVIL